LEEGGEEHVVCRGFLAESDGDGFKEVDQLRWSGDGLSKEFCEDWPKGDDEVVVVVVVVRENGEAVFAKIGWRAWEFVF
jgi:hypothetical protein